MARRPAAPLGAIEVVVEGHDLPGRWCGPDLEGRGYDNIHVGLWKKGGAVGLVAGDAAIARWDFEVVVKEDEAGKLDFGGPFVDGSRDERHLGLVWQRQLEDGTWSIFRGTKFRLYEMEGSLFREALQPGRRLVGRLGLTDEQGFPRCATVRPPLIIWAVENAADSDR